MRFIDAAGIPAGTELVTDVCIIGSGAAGLTLARELAGSHRDVLLMEAGGLKRDAATETDTFETDSTGEPLRNPLPGRVRVFGGSTTAWFGRIATPDPIEFAPRPWVTCEGWPLTLDELQPWLQRAADILELPDADQLATGGSATDIASNPVCEHPDADTRTFLWAKGTEMAPRASEVLGSAANVRVVVRAAAVEFVPGESASCIAYLVASRPEGRRFVVRASTYVLATGGIENPRLLLASNSVWPAGVGNQRGLVGRFYMDHPRDESSARVELRGLPARKLQLLRALAQPGHIGAGSIQRRLVFNETAEQRERLLHHSLHGYLGFPGDDVAGLQAARRVTSWVGTRPALRQVVRDSSLVVRDAHHLARVAAGKVNPWRMPDRFVVVDQMEQVPDPRSRLTLNWDIRDSLGLPRPRLNWRVGDDTYVSQRRMHELFADILKRAGIPGFSSRLLDDPDYRPQLLDMKHPMGTTRMGRTAETGVVDPNCRVHGVENLYIAGSSVFPVGGHANPTLLIVALAARLAARLKTQPSAQM